ncbi:hypothetical protein DXG01_009217, partial [Tephrocybe rancida]
PDAIVCINACFTQKRNRQARDPPRTHPRTVFIPEQDAEAMEKYVDFIRVKKAPAKKRTNTEEPDHLEGSLHVPKSVLDGCEAGFTAADSCREKASMQFFDDTTLMALLCCHDIVLFIANMRSAGEKQHYVMVLVETFFQHLPLPYRVGLLYDIGCQTERSCIKRGPSDRYTERLIFSISVFHAFGHQWYHQRLYTLDRQVDHAQRETLENLGAWLLRRSQHALTKQKAAESILRDCGKSETDLRAEWKDQVEMQTKPLPRQSQNAGKDAVKELLQMHETRDGLKKWEHEYDALIEDEATPMDEYAEAKADLESVHVRLQDLTTRIRNKQSVLGVTDRA